MEDWHGLLDAVRLARRVTDGVARSLPVMDASDSLFEVLTPLGFRARVTTARWKVIANAKHPVIAGREPLVKTALEAPDEVHQSRVDAQVVLFYKAEARKRRTCAVLKRVADGALLKTA